MSGSMAQETCPDRDVQDVRRREVQGVEGQAWLRAEDVPAGFLPEGFSVRVLLKALDLVDKLAKGTMIVLASFEHMGKVLGFPLNQERSAHWKSTRKSIMEELTAEELEDMTRDGAAVLCPFSGRALEVTVQLLPGEEPLYRVEGGTRSDTAFRVSRCSTFRSVVLLKKKKEGSEFEKCKTGWVSCFSSSWSQHGDLVPQFYKYVYPTGASAPRISESDAQRISEVLQIRARERVNRLDTSSAHCSAPRLTQSVSRGASAEQVPTASPLEPQTVEESSTLMELIALTHTNESKPVPKDDKKIHIGHQRFWQNDFKIIDNAISTSHCMVKWYAPEKAGLTQLSNNISFVNNHKVVYQQSWSLQHGDCVALRSNTLNSMKDPTNSQASSKYFHVFRLMMGGKKLEDRRAHLVEVRDTRTAWHIDRGSEVSPCDDIRLSSSNEGRVQMLVAPNSSKTVYVDGRSFVANDSVWLKNGNAIWVAEKEPYQQVFCAPPTFVFVGCNRRALPTPCRAGESAASASSADVARASDIEQIVGSQSQTIPTTQTVQLASEPSQSEPPSQPARHVNDEETLPLGGVPAAPTQVDEAHEPDGTDTSFSSFQCAPGRRFPEQHTEAASPREPSSDIQAGLKRARDEEAAQSISILQDVQPPPPKRVSTDVEPIRHGATRSTTFESLLDMLYSDDEDVAEDLQGSNSHGGNAAFPQPLNQHTAADTIDIDATVQ